MCYHFIVGPVIITVNKVHQQADMFRLFLSHILATAKKACVLPY